MTEIELGGLVEQHTGLTDKHSPAYAQAYRLAHAVATAAAVIDRNAVLEEAAETCAELVTGCNEEGAVACMNAIRAMKDVAEQESRKDLPSPAPEDGQ